MFYQLPTFQKKETKILNFYFSNATNTIFIEKEPISIRHSTFQRTFPVAGTETWCRYEIEIPLPPYRYFFKEITILGNVTNAGIDYYYYLYLEECKSPILLSKEFEVNELSNCINRKIKEKEKKVTIYLEQRLSCNLNLDSVRVLFKYPAPYRFGLENPGEKENIIKNDFISTIAENDKIIVKGKDSEISIDTVNSFFISSIPKNEAAINSEEIKGVATKINLTFLKDQFKKINYWIESERVQYFNKKSSDDFFSIFYLKGFDSWFNVYINFKNHYKFLTKLTIENQNYDIDGNLISFSNALFELTINRKLIPTYYENCTDLIIYTKYRNSADWEKVPMRLVSSNGEICKFELFIRELIDKLDLYIYHYNKKDYLKKDEDLTAYAGSIPKYITNVNLIFSNVFNFPKRYSKIYFELKFTLNNKISEVYYYTYNPLTREYIFNTNSELHYSDQNNLLLDNILIKTEKNDYILFNFNHYFGNPNYNTVEKGIRGLSINISENNILIKAKDSNLKDWLIAFSFLKNNTKSHDYLKNNITYDIINPFLIKDYIKQPFAILKNNFDLLAYAKTFTSMREGEELFLFYEDFNFQVEDLTEIEKETEFIEKLKNKFILSEYSSSNFEINENALVIYPTINTEATFTMENLIETNAEFENVVFEIVFSLLSEESKLIVSKSGLKIEIPGSITCNLQKNKKYLALFYYDTSSVDVKIYDPNLNLICESSFPITNSLSSIRFGTNSINGLMVDNNFELNGIKIYSLKVYELTKNNILVNPTINEDNFGYISEINLPSSGFWLVKILDKHKSLYISNNSEFCYLNEEFECSFYPTNFIYIKNFDNKAYFKVVENKLLYYTTLITPGYSLIPNSKQIQIDASNAVLGISEYNLVWREKNWFSFLGNNYPITTRKGNINWKIIRGLHEYTDILLYSVLDYPFNSQIMSNIYYILKDSQIEIIK